MRRGGEGIGKVRRVSRGTQGLEAGRGDRGVTECDGEVGGRRE